MFINSLTTFLFAAFLALSMVISVDGHHHAIAGGTQLVAGSASGNVKINGKSLSLKYAYAVAQPNLIDENKTDIAVLLTEKPIPDGALREVSDLWAFAAHNLHGWVLFKINEKGKAISETIDHPELKGERLLMTGFTHAEFIPRFDLEIKDRIEGAFITEHVEDFLKYKYEIKVKFNASILQAKRLEALPGAKTGTKLPADGGEPGKMYMAYYKALKKKDNAAMRMIMSLGPDISDMELKEQVEMMNAMTPENVKIESGYAKEDKAVLYLMGTMDGQNQYGTVGMEKKNGEWRIIKENWSDKPSDK